MSEKKQIQIEYEELEWKELSLKEQEGAQKAIDMLEKAYAPYSKFSVGACVLLADGSLVSGANQENAAYPSGLCAERVALFAANANHPNIPVEQLFIVAKPQAGQNFATAHSCGNCRQVMIESESRQATPFSINIIIPDKKVIRIPSARTYLPFAFDGSSMKQAGD